MTDIEDQMNLEILEMKNYLLEHYGIQVNIVINPSIKGA